VNVELTSAPPTFPAVEFLQTSWSPRNCVRHLYGQQSLITQGQLQ